MLRGLALFFPGIAASENSKESLEANQAASFGDADLASDHVRDRDDLVLRIKLLVSMNLPSANAYRESLRRSLILEIARVQSELDLVAQNRIGRGGLEQYYGDVRYRLSFRAAEGRLSRFFLATDTSRIAH